MCVNILSCLAVVDVVAVFLVLFVVIIGCYYWLLLFVVVFVLVVFFGGGLRGMTEYLYMYVSPASGYSGFYWRFAGVY